jgi:hypothetical protein
MDPRLKVSDPLRPVPNPSKDLPIVTLAWRALREEHKRRSADRRREEEQRELNESLAIAVADECFRLRRMAASPGRDEAEAAALRAAVGRLEAALGELGIEILAPAGAPYAGELTSIFDNTAQRPGNAPHAVLGEVLVVAVLRGNRLLRGGRGVVELPTENPEHVTPGGTGA